MALPSTFSSVHRKGQQLGLHAANLDLAEFCFVAPIEIEPSVEIELYAWQGFAVYKRI
jgi:hypothetical protein